MSAPPVKEGKFSVYFDKLDSIFVSSIRPRCFICNDYFNSNEVAVTIRGPQQTIRVSKDCFKELVNGVYLFEENSNSMKVFNTTVN